MANHSYVTLKDPTTVKEADHLLCETLMELFGATFKVTIREDLETPWGAARVWLITLPLSAPEQDPTQPEDYGFLVLLQDNLQTWEFRHPLNKWERWVQARFYHTLAHKLGCEIKDDATVSFFPPREEFLTHTTFHEYITRHLPKPLDSGNKAWGQRMVNDFAPPQFRKIDWQ